jgi:ParB-like chromosome segregation protein Spo0J
MQHPPHPLASMLPDLSQGEYESLKESIRDVGQQEPILLFEEMILDGRRRNL